MAIPVVALFCWFAPAQASLVIEGTRVVFPSSARDVTVGIVNPDTNAYLMQAWLDTTSEAESRPDTSKAPFMLTPVVSRIDAGERRSIRIVPLAATLPQDRESIFYLHVLGVPAMPSDVQADDNFVQVAVRSVIKVFYRPAALKSTDAVAAPAALVWRLVPQGRGHALEAHNPTPFHVSFSQFSVDVDGKTIDDFSGGMVGPGQTVVMSTPRLNAHLAQGGIAIRYTALNDWGGRMTEPLTLAK
ncbi:molecular chaperone [Variovorax sp. YR216]|uniref:fimbrial biogenesis chaperone n=1 Tax=Variovorax sp. YR216 TaxID=1882828 RepID=UPI000896702D|nr:molecular chaperone [Variovorax sp. YR216]SEB21208.1 chaperone protein EcpD [Variovorax sp. YR216]